MASTKTIKQGDLTPSLKGQASDENGVVDLTLADSLAVFLKTGSTLITGVAVPIDPPTADADGIHSWNWEYIWVAGDTDIPGTYKVELETTTDGKDLTYPSTGTETLVIEASLDGA